jgi:hypothetical protein
MENQVQQGTMDFNMAVIINKPQFPKFVHEIAHAGPSCADHLSERLLADIRKDRFWLTFLAKATSRLSQFSESVCDFQ